MRALMWFRSDLRVDDNTALSHACKHADKGVIAVFTVCPTQWLDHDWGTMKVSFIMRNLQALSEQLEKLNIPLLLTRRADFDAIPKALLDLAKKHKCDGLYFNKEYEVNELARDERVTELFKANDLGVCAYDDQVAIDVSQIRSSTGGFYTVFTPFKRKWCEWYKTDGHLNSWSKPKRQPGVQLTSSKIPNSLSEFKGSGRTDLWPEGEQAAKKRLRQFVNQRISAYDRQRDSPNVNGTSTLSPYLALQRKVGSR